MKRTGFAGTFVAALLSLTIVAPPVAAEQSWELVPPFDRTGTDYWQFGYATASPDGSITATATLGGSFFYSSAQGWAGATLTWPISDRVTDTKTLSVTATIEITGIRLVGPGSSAWVGVTAETLWGRSGCGHQSVNAEDAGKVFTVTCAVEHVTSGDAVAGGAGAFASDRTLDGWVQTGYSTASVQAVVRNLSVTEVAS